MENESDQFETGSSNEPTVAAGAATTAIVLTTAKSAPSGDFAPGGPTF